MKLTNPFRDVFALTIPVPHCIASIHQDFLRVSAFRLIPGESRGN